MSFGNEIVSLHNGKCSIRSRKAEGSLEFTPVPTLVIGYLSSIDETRNQNFAIKILKGQYRSAPVPPSPLVSLPIVNKLLPSKRTSEPLREKTKTVSFAVKSNVAKRKVDDVFNNEERSDEDEETYLSANQKNTPPRKYNKTMQSPGLKWSPNPNVNSQKKTATNESLSHLPPLPPPVPAVDKPSTSSSLVSSSISSAASCSTCSYSNQPQNFRSLEKCPKCPSFPLFICKDTEIGPDSPKMVQVQPYFGPNIKYIRVLVNDDLVINVPESLDPNKNRKGIPKLIDSDGTFYVPVMNVTKQTILLRKGRSIGKCQILK